MSSLKGGVGKTTVALGLASAAFARSLRTLVVDLDAQRDASTGLGATQVSKASVLEVLQKPSHNIVIDSIVASGWTRGNAGKLDVMVGNSKISSYDTAIPNLRDIWKLEEALAHVENQYDLVIIDTPPSLGGLLRTAWAASDRVLVVAEPGIFAVSSVDRSLQAIAELHDQLNDRLAPVGVVVNRTQQNLMEHDFRLNELKERTGDFYLDVNIPERSSMQQAQGAARAIHSWPGESAAEISESFNQLLNRVMDSFKEEVSRSQRRRDRDSLKHKNRWLRKRDKKAAKPTLENFED
ncbi:MAG: ParA family protein [Micrococcales bacterium]